MTTPTPEAIEAGVASGMDTHDWELLKSQGDIGEAVELAIRDALSVAAPFIAAQAKAEALAPVLALHKETRGVCINCYNDDDEWQSWPCATYRAATIEGKDS